MNTSVNACGFLVSAAALLLGALGAPARAASGPYVAAHEIDLASFLAPPPAPGSASQAADLAAVLEAQATRGEAGVAAARLDQEVSVGRFADVLGPHFNAGRLPRVFALNRKACREAAAMVGAAKRHFDRPRPYAVSAEVRPVAAVSSDQSYPSGHATCGYLWAILLGEMLPEQRAALFERGVRYGQQRVVGGVHYPTDVEAGRISAAVIAGRMLANPAFRADLQAAREEIRRALQ